MKINDNSQIKCDNLSHTNSINLYFLQFLNSFLQQVRMASNLKTLHLTLKLPCKIMCNI